MHTKNKNKKKWGQNNIQLYVWGGLMRNTIKWGQNNIYMVWPREKHNLWGQFNGDKTIYVAWPNEEHKKIMTKQYLWPGLMRNTIKWGQNNICGLAS